MLLQTACNKQETLPPQDVGYSFFPYSPGDYIQYDVDSTHYDDFADTVKNYSFKLIEYYESYFYDEEGRKCIRIERWIKTTDSTKWFLRDVWYSCLTSTFAERLEENVRLTKLAFPIKYKNKWNGNAFNTDEAQIYEYENFNKPYLVNNINFDTTVTVTQSKLNNLIEEKNQYEIYAKHTGLVYKKHYSVKKDFLTGKVVSGVDYIWRYKNSGKFSNNLIEI